MSSEICNQTSKKSQSNERATNQPTKQSTSIRTTCKSKSHLVSQSESQSVIPTIKQAEVMKHLSGHESSFVSEEEIQELAKDFEGLRKGKLITLSPGGWRFTERFQEGMDKIYNFKFRSSDVVVMTWPKCGTHWTQEIVWTMNYNPNLDLKDVDNFIMARSPFLEADFLGPKRQFSDADPVSQAFNKHCPGKDPDDGVHLQLAECVPDPRIIKTHFPLSLVNPSLLDTAKVVYVARNPKDVIISYYHHCRIIRGIGYVGSFEDFVKYFVEDKAMYCPYWLHLQEAWESRNHPNLLFLFYEDMKEDPLREIKKIDAFLGTNLTQAQLEGIVKYTSFAAMKARSSNPLDIHMKKEIVEKDGGMFRKGESGDWKSKFTPELDELANQWIHKNLDGLGIRFKYSV